MFEIPTAGQDREVKELVLKLKTAETFLYASKVDPDNINFYSQHVDFTITEFNRLIDSAHPEHKQVFKKLLSDRDAKVAEVTRRMTLLKLLRSSAQGHLDHILSSRKDSWRNYRSMYSHIGVVKDMRDIAIYSAEISYLEAALAAEPIIELNLD